MVKEQLSRDQFRLYQLIYNRFLASQMAGAVYSVKSVKVSCGDATFQTSASKIAFDGFLAVYNLDNDRGETVAGINNLAEGDVLELDGLEEKQHFTQPPARYTEALLVKTLEELGIGRPSTYAPFRILTLLTKFWLMLDVLPPHTSQENSQTAMHVSRKNSRRIRSSQKSSWVCT